MFQTMITWAKDGGWSVSGVDLLGSGSSSGGGAPLSAALHRVAKFDLSLGAALIGSDVDSGVEFNTDILTLRSVGRLVERFRTLAFSLGHAQLEAKAWSIRAVPKEESMMMPWLSSESAASAPLAWPTPDMDAAAAQQRGFTTYLDLVDLRAGTMQACLAETSPPFSCRQLKQFVDSDPLAPLCLAPTDRVCSVLPNGIHAACALLTFAQVRICSPANPNLSIPELASMFEGLNADAVLSLHGQTCNTAISTAAAESMASTLELMPAPQGLFTVAWRERRAPPRTQQIKANGPSREDPAVLLHAVGTAAKSRLVPLTHEGIAVGALCIAGTLQLRPDDICLAAMPLFHIHGLLVNILASLFAGGSVLITDGTEAGRCLAVMEAALPTWTSGVATMQTRLLAELNTARIPSRTNLRFIRGAGMALLPAVSTNLEAVLGCMSLHAYEKVESTPMTSNPPTSTRSLCTVGSPAGPECAIVREDDGFPCSAGEVGEICVRGACVMTDDRILCIGEDRWLGTADRGWVNSLGQLVLAGRLLGRLRRGSGWVSPFEAEFVASHMPATGVANMAAGSSGSAGGAVVAPRTADEAAALEAFASVLGVGDAASVSVEASFFELGGNSLRAVVLARRLSAALGREVGVAEVLGRRTVAALSHTASDGAFVVASSPTTRPAKSLHWIIPPNSPGQEEQWLPRACFCVHDFTGQVLAFRHFARWSRTPCVGVRCTPNLASIADTLHDLARAYVGELAQIVTAQLAARLVGFSFGCRIAYLMACVQEVQGIHVQLALLDGSIDPIGASGTHPMLGVIPWLRRAGRVPEHEQRPALDDLVTEVMRASGRTISHTDAKHVRALLSIGQVIQEEGCDLAEALVNLPDHESPTFGGSAMVTFLAGAQEKDHANSTNQRGKIYHIDTDHYGLMDERAEEVARIVDALWAVTP